MAASYIRNQGNRFAFDRSIGAELVVATGSSTIIATHTHVSTLVIILVRTGRIRLCTDLGERYINAGDTVVVPPHQAHGLHAMGKFVMATLCLNRILFVPKLSIKHRKSVKVFLHAMVNQGYLSVNEMHTFFEVLRKISINPHDDNDSLSQLRRSLEENPENQMSLKEMAQAAHIEKGHLIRRFKKRYGITPHSFITQNRLRKARRNLIGQHSLTDSALMAGFYDQSHFIRNFIKLHGMTPTDYLRACSPVQTGINTTAE